MEHGTRARYVKGCRYQSTEGRDIIGRMPLLYALAGLAALLTSWIGWYANKHGHDGELPVHTAEVLIDGKLTSYTYVDLRDYQP